MKDVEINSRRLDVPAADDASMPKPGLKYMDMGKQDTLKALQDAMALPKDVRK